VHLELDGQGDPAIARVEPGRFDIRLQLAQEAVGASASNRAALKLVSKRTCNTLTFASGGWNACGSGLHNVISGGSQLSQTVGSV
jgi:hypothetical protein